MHVHTGEMEETFLRSQAHAAHLMSLIEGNEEIRSQAAEAVKAIQRDTNHGDEGLALATLYNLKLDDDLQGRNYQLGPLSNEENKLLKTRLAEKYNTMDDDAPERLLVHELRDITIETVRYARMGCSLYDCDARVSIIVKGQTEMGIIQNIIRIPIRDPPEFSGWDTYLIVQLFPRPTQKSVAEDPYATWQKLLSLELKLELNIPGCLYPSMDANPCRVIIEPEDIQSHIACTDIAPDLVHIRPISRVRQRTLFHQILKCKANLTAVASPCYWNRVCFGQRLRAILMYYECLYYTSVPCTAFLRTVRCLNVHIGKFKLMAVVTLIDKADFIAIGHTGTKCFARIKNLWRHGRTCA